MSDVTNGSPEKIPCNRFASGEYERSLTALQGERSIAKSRSKARLFAVGLAVATLLAVGGGAVYAQGQGGSMMGGNAAKSGADDSGMGGMMNGGMTGSMMSDHGGMGSMMGEQSMSGAQTMGSFDEEQPFDLQFIDQMIMHHQGAIMSSEHMISDSERPELRQLAEDIQQSQSEQIEQMQEWRGEWYGDGESTFGMMDPTQMEGMMEQMMDGSMQEMMGGDATDAMFLRMMIPHHQMAVDMSEEALDGNAEHPELAELAQSIRDEQSAEIELMQGYLDEIEASAGGQQGLMMEANESHH